MLLPEGRWDGRLERQRPPGAKPPGENPLPPSNLTNLPSVFRCRYDRDVLLRSGGKARSTLRDRGGRWRRQPFAGRGGGTVVARLLAMGGIDSPGDLRKQYKDVGADCWFSSDGRCELVEPCCLGLGLDVASPTRFGYGCAPEQYSATDPVRLEADLPSRSSIKNGIS